jgi:hypothetical protein
MAAESRYYSATDIMRILAGSRVTACEILHSFAARGQLYQQGRILRVRTDYFEQYLKDTEARSKASISKRKEA